MLQLTITEKIIYQGTQRGRDPNSREQAEAGFRSHRFQFWLWQKMVSFIFLTALKKESEVCFIETKLERITVIYEEIRRRTSLKKNSERLTMCHIFMHVYKML